MRARERRRVFERYDAVLCDLDGVVYRGDQIVGDAPVVLDEVRAAGSPVVFLTNNSSRTVDEVASKLREMGVQADPAEVVSSAIATAAMLRRDGTVTGPPEAGTKRDRPTAFVIGRRGIRTALEDAGVEILDGTPDRTDLVVVGFDPDTNYAALRTAGLLVQGGARLIGTNPDGSYPAPDGLWPGAGALLAAVVATTRAVPTVVGKPARPMFEAAAESARARHPLVVGDRLDTDIAGARAMGWDAMLVLTGASSPRDLVRSGALPHYVGTTIQALVAVAPRVEIRPASKGDLQVAKVLAADAGLRWADPSPGRGATLVADAGGELVATATAFHLPEATVLRAVAVRQDVRGRGVGTLVVAGTARAAAERGARLLVAFTETAERFFERLGFTAVDRDALPESVRSSEHAGGECSSATPLEFDLR